MAYSTKIHDPAFERYRQNSKNYGFLFGLGLAVVAIAGFYLYGESGGDMENPEAVTVGFVIGGMFLLIGVYAARSKNVRPTWDGMVTGKNVKKERRKSARPGEQEWRMVYTILIKSENGTTEEIRVEDDDTLFNYFRKGEKVRYHGALRTYEKFDKSGDDIIFCNACGFLHEMEEEVCRNCGCPLLK